MIIPVVLSGGAGSRLWPMSREGLPKQFLPLVNKERSLLQDTVARVSDRQRFAAPIVVCNNQHRFLVAESLRDLGIEDGTIILEPTGKNTAPAIALAAHAAVAISPEAVLLVLSSDNGIRDLDAFSDAIDHAVKAAEAGNLVTFGITPEFPATEYGYIQASEGLPGHAGVRKIAKFIEKPSEDVAIELLKDDNVFWNSAMFAFRADVFLAELEQTRPEILERTRVAMQKGEEDLDFFRPDVDSFNQCPSESVDYALFEISENTVVVPCDIGWSDLGSWQAIWELEASQNSGSSPLESKDHVAIDCSDIYVRTDGPLIATLGLESIAVIGTEDAVLVFDKSRSQDVKQIVELLKKLGRPEAVQHTEVLRPWGGYKTLVTGDRFQAKLIWVKTQHILSLQKHYHRAEHWIVTKGTARVTVGEETKLLSENESVYIPIGVVHRLENPGHVPLELIEVQVGSYLGEDDIVRLDDVYGRTGQSHSN
jgi:mannose-1-phosphate guanylyltransferase/mannose-6-phosphate isomerase